MSDPGAETVLGELGADPEDSNKAPDGTAGSAAAVFADAYAGAALMFAVGVGTVLSLLYVLSGNAAFRTPWEPVDLSFLLPGVLYPVLVLLPLVVPALVIFGAYLFVARTESRLNVRRQRGALVLFGFAAPFLPLPLWSVT